MLWWIMYVNDTMSDAEYVEGFTFREEAMDHLEKIAGMKFSLGKIITWKNPEEFTYRSDENTYNIHYYLERH